MRSILALAISATLVMPVSERTSGHWSATPQEVERVDYLTFAQGAVPIGIGGAGAEQGANMTHAVQIVDGDVRGFSIVNRATSETDVEFVYALPALTTFDRLAVPEVRETPSPSQTFFKEVEVHGSAAGPDGPWTLLARGTLATHESRGQVTELAIEASEPVQWVRIRMADGIEMLAEQMFLEFGEIIGNGTQEVPALVDHFSGTWRGRGVTLRLLQDGGTVAGCYDRGSPLTGTVTGNLLRAIGVGVSDAVISHFILGVTDDGSVRGVRSTNGAPFRLYTGPSDEREVECAEPVEPTLGCGSVIHGINFGFDSAEIREDSNPVLRTLFEGLSADSSNEIVVEGHTSSEGSDAYNLDLSERRSGAVVQDLVRRGIDGSRLAPVGRGESTPIASNDDEAGRSLNRRVEIHCG